MEVLSDGLPVLLLHAQSRHKDNMNGTKVFMMCKLTNLTRYNAIDDDKKKEAVPKSG